MLFNSFLYIIFFLPITVFLFYKTKINKFYLLIFASLIFYSYYKVEYVFLILFIVCINFFFGKVLCSKKEHLIKNRKNYLLISIAFNILILCIFKYLDFFVDNINFIFESNISYLNIPYPLAISFITFQQIIFLVDCYDDKISKINFKNYFLFIVFFPQLIAGPITRFNLIDKQFNKEDNFNYNFENLSKGLFLISIGLFKKVVLSDSLSFFVIPGFENYQSLDTLSTWLVSISFTLQFYFDFSAYSDFALGTGLLFNIILPKNFNSPLKSLSIIDFWQRWHMTLTYFLTNYVFMGIAKKFNQLSFSKSMYSIILTFLIAGIWHGPSWNFVVFGLWHGICIVINHIFRKFDINLHFILGWFFTITAVNIGFIIFRSLNLNQAMEMVLKLFFINVRNKEDYNIFVNLLPGHLLNFNSILLIISIVVIFLKKNSNKYSETLKPKIKYIFGIFFMFLFSFLTMNSSNEFIYFNF